MDMGATGEPVLALYAVSLKNSGETQAALSTAIEAVQRYPDSYNANYLAGIIFLEQGQWGEAANRLEKAYELDPDAENALVALATASARSGSPDAIRYFERLAAMPGWRQSPELLNEWALFYVRKQMPTKALRIFNDAKELPAVAPEIYLNLAITYDVHMEQMTLQARREMAKRNYVKYMLGDNDPATLRRIQQRLRELQNPNAFSQL